MEKISDIQLKDIEIKIGDRVQLTDDGGTFPHYALAFRHFGILDKAERTNGRYKLIAPYNYDDLVWVVKGFAMHPSESEGLIVHLESGQWNVVSKINKLKLLTIYRSEYFKKEETNNNHIIIYQLSR